MTEVHLRPITFANYRECLSLRTADSQAGFVATNAQSLAEAYVNPALVPLAIYDGAARGYEESPTPMVGFTVYELAAGVGLILRLMIGHAYPGQVYRSLGFVAWNISYATPGGEEVYLRLP